MLETHEKEIDGRRYVYQPLMLKPARALFDKLLKRFGPAIAAAVEGLQNAELRDDMAIDQALGHVAGSAGGLIRGIVEGLDEKFHADLCDTLARQTQVDLEGDGKLIPLWDVRELIFGKNLLSEFRVVSFALEAQYADFLEPVRNLAATALALRAKAGSNSNYPKASSGSRTGSPQASDTTTA